ncbi:MAG: zinc ribbon domain-containing protein [Firmicutes bacterium]|nr:zinc ribbon domain-containing protein [Bacillota bacterium]
MPTYDFRCSDCGHKFTIMASISDRDKTTCPACRSAKVEQLFTGCQVRTSGGGGCHLPPPGAGGGG